jgi:2'-5' RNA ligase
MQYTSCFIGISVPREFVAELHGAAEAVSSTLTDLEIADMQTPHITIYYLNEQSQLDLETVVAEVRKHKNQLAGSRVEIGRMGVFGGEKPRLLYVQAECSDSLYKFHDEISVQLKMYRAVDNDFGFVPHITLGRIKLTESNNFIAHQAEVSNILQKVSLGFEVQELCIYGVDSRKVPERQTKLLTIAV